MVETAKFAASIENVRHENGDTTRITHGYLVTIDGDPALISVLINGKLVRRHHHMLGERGSLNLTPFVRFGEENEIELVRWGQSDVNSSPSNGAPMRTLREISINFFDPKAYP